MACEAPAARDVPLARYSIGDVRRQLLERGLVESIGRTTVWRILDADAIRPWFHRCWLFPRDPDFADHAAPVIDLYLGSWQGQPLDPRDCVLSTDEKTGVGARRPIHPTQPPGPGRPARVEFEYTRHGAFAYFAAWDVRRGTVSGRCEETTGVAPFLRLVEQVMDREPYRSAPRVFWIMDNGPSHRGQTNRRRLAERWPTIVPVHTPVHASWLNQVEVYFSICARKLLTPGDFDSRADLRRSIARFEAYLNARPTPFNWRFTRLDLQRLIERLDPATPFLDAA